MSTYTEAEAAAVARVAATPNLVAIHGDSQNTQIAVLPPGWTSEAYTPADDPKRFTGRIVTRTAAGFVAEMDRLTRDFDTPVVYRNDTTLVGHPARNDLDGSAYDQTVVELEPKLSLEFTMLNSARGLTLSGWEQFVEDFAAAIDAVENQPAPSAADVLNDARTWDVEIRRTIRRIKAENGSEDAKDDLEAKVRTTALAAFKVRIPIFEHTDPVDLLVRIDRDLDSQHITARIPQRDQIVRWARDAIFNDAAEIGAFTPVI